ncbi:MAG TPA: extracellular solute-binding protein [Alphaproteobacteria bacterium]|nr:extracellular solute-binding protein [Alphaproteobacteria bacterium]
MMLRRDFLKTGAAALAGSAALGAARDGAAAGKPQQLRVLTWGGPWASALKEGVDAAFTKATGIPVVQEATMVAYERVDKLKANLANQIYDVVQLYDEVWPFAMFANVVAPINKSSPRYKNLNAVYPRFVHPLWVAQCFTAIGIAYNIERVKNAPVAFADLWRPDLKGQLALPNMSDVIGADMIPIGALAAGKDPKDAEAGFAMLQKLAQQQPIWTKDGYSRMTALRDGKATVAILTAADVYRAQSMGAHVKWVYPKEGAISYSWGTGIAMGTKNQEWAEIYLDQTLDPANQAFFSRTFDYAGTNSNSLGQLTPELQARVRFTTAELNRLVELDHAFIAQHRKEWTERWNKATGAG